jgi:hypothetical protein
LEGISITELQNLTRPPPRQIPADAAQAAPPCQGARPSSFVRFPSRSPASALIQVEHTLDWRMMPTTMTKIDQQVSALQQYYFPLLFICSLVYVGMQVCEL